MSATQSWSVPVSSRPRARFFTTCQLCRDKVVGGTNGFFLMHKRLSSRMMLSTRLWLTTSPSDRAQTPADAPVAVVPVLQRQALDGIAHHSLLPARCRSLEVAVVAGPADAGQQAHSLDARHALRAGRRQRRDGRVDDLAPDPSLGWRPSLMVRKAC